MIFAACAYIYYLIVLEPKIGRRRLRRQIREEEILVAERTRMERDAMPRVGNLRSGGKTGVQEGRNTDVNGEKIIECKVLEEAKVPATMSVQI